MNEEINNSIEHKERELLFKEKRIDVWEKYQIILEYEDYD